MSHHHSYTIAALYHFAPFTAYKSFKAPLEAKCAELELKGTILLASEGINGTIAGSDSAIKTLILFLRTHPLFKALEYKISHTRKRPFYRMKVRLKKEIVTMGVCGIEPHKTTGTYVAPQDWNTLISSPDVLLIDTRNEYEVEIGTFKGAINPKTQNFRQFPDWVQNNRNRLNKPKIAMFCTGGIRCEKASAYMKQQGFDEVYHLKGGILKYLETQTENNSLWQGDCFIFDQRVAIGHGLRESQYDQCFACRYPITTIDKASPLYIKGISCPRCHKKISTAQKARFSERQKQIELAHKRNQPHIGRKA